MNEYNSQIEVAKNNEIASSSEEKNIIRSESGVEGDENINLDNVSSEMNEMTAMGLPEIKDGDRIAPLIIKGDKQIIAMRQVNNSTHRNYGLIVTCKQGRSLIANEKDIVFSKSEIMNATSDNCIKSLKKLQVFDMEITLDDLKCALDRMKEFMIKGAPTEDLNSTLSVDEVYKQIVAPVMKGIVLDSQEILSTFKVNDPGNGMISIKSENFKKVLEEYGYRPVDFCRKIQLFCEYEGIDPLIITKNKGRWSNNYSDGRYYVLRIEKNLL